MGSLVRRVLILSLLLLVFGVVHAQSGQGVMEEEDTPCLKHMRKVLSPEGLGDLVQVALNSAKGLNELGDYESCNADGLEYSLLALELMPIGFTVLRLGLCVPQECANQESFKGISDYIEKMAAPSLPDDAKIVAKVTVPKEVLAESMSTGAIELNIN